MAIIYSYPQGSSALRDDRLIITRIDEEENEITTKQLTLGQIADYTVTTNDIVTGTGTPNYITMWGSGGGNLVDSQISTTETEVSIEGDLAVTGDITANNLSGFLQIPNGLPVDGTTVVQDGLGNDSALQLGRTGQGAKVANKFIVENATDNTKFTRIDEFGIQLGRNSSRIVPDAANHTLEIGQNNQSWGKIKMDAKTFEIKSASDNIVVINENGNVGLSTYPDNENRLHVKGNISIEEGTFNGNDTGARISFSKKDGTKVGGIGFDKDQLNGTGGTYQQMYISAKHDIISTPNYEAIRIDIENNLGVKVSGANLRATLDVGGAIKIGSEDVTVNGYVKGMLRYRELTDRSIVEMCMKIANNGAASDYAFITIQENIW